MSWAVSEDPFTELAYATNHARSGARWRAHLSAAARRQAAAASHLELREFQSDSLQRHAIEFGQWMLHAGLQRARALGHTRLRPAHARLMVWIDWEGTRSTDIARAQDISKNAVGQLVTELEDMGYVERVADPRDGRAKIVRYTDAGIALLSDSLAISTQLDAEIAAILGAERMAQLRSLLAEIFHNLPDYRARGADQLATEPDDGPD
jgi:DNA-binding MarR family transcriptional regulator